MKKTEISNIYKTDEGSLINNDIKSLHAYRAKKHNLKKIDGVEKEISDMKSDIQEIKELLKGLIK